MVTLTDGSTLTDGTEQTLWDISTTNFFGGWIGTDVMAAGDSLRIRAYVKDAAAGTMRTYIDETISGVQANPMYFIVMVPTDEHKVTVQRITGTDRTYKWRRAVV